MSLFKPEHMSIKEIIEKLEEAVNLGDSPHRGPFGTHIRKEYLVEAIEKLRTHPEAQPNDPLTLEELREMDGKPIFTYSEQFPCDCGWRVIKQIVVNSDVEFTDGWSFGLDGYGKNWLAYHRPPKDG